MPVPTRACLLVSNFGGDDDLLNLQNKSADLEPSFMAGDETNKSKNLNSLTHEPASKEAVRNGKVSVTVLPKQKFLELAL